MIGGMLRDRRCTYVETGTAAVAVKSGCERIEILAGDDIFRGKQVIDFIAGVTIAVKQHREVGVIGLYTGHDRTEADAGNAFQAGKITGMDGFPFPDFTVQMTEQTETHGSAEFIHFRIAADVRNFFRPVNAEVFQIIQLGAEGRIPVADGAAFNGVENLGGMEGKHGGIAETSGADTVFYHAEGVSGIIDNFEMMPGGDSRNGFDIAEVAVDMHREDGNGFIRNEGLYF